MREIHEKEEKKTIKRREKKKRSNMSNSLELRLR